MFQVPAVVQDKWYDAVRGMLVCEVVRRIQNSWSRISCKGEPEMIRDYLREGLKYLNKEVSRRFSKYLNITLKFAGVFVHQRPRVGVYAPSLYREKVCNCELGDLLTVVAWVKGSKNGRQVIFSSAFISQAKKHVGEIHKNGCQMFLYELSPGIEYTDLNKRIGKSCISLSMRYDLRCRSFNYLVLSDFSSHPCPYVIPARGWWDLRECPVCLLPPLCCELYECCLPISCLDLSWGIVILNSIFGFYGLPFSVQGTDDWSILVNYLLEVIGRKLVGGYPRGSYLEEIINKFNDFDNYNNAFYEIEDEGLKGLPLLLIIVHVGNEREKTLF